MANRIAMVVFSYYPADPRPRREAEALVESGMSVDAICLKGAQEAKKEIVNGVEVYRLSLQRKRAGKTFPGMGQQTRNREESYWLSIR